MVSGKKIGFFATSLLMGSLTVSSFGQATTGGNPPVDPNNPQPRQRGNFDPAQFRQRMMDRLKTELGATDDEMTALAPKIQKVMDLERDARGGRGFGRRGGGGPGGQGGTPAPAPADANASPVQKASTDLRAVLENKDAKPDEIKAKLDALRAARAEAKTQLAAAQQELRGLLTQRQEAVLVESGTLE